METLLGIIVGIGLAASCGFRVFVPMLVMSIAVKAGQLQLTEGWAWIGSWPALISFAVATLIEIAGFYIPWLDNLLDSIATPAAVVAGTVAMATCVSHMSPLLQWSTAIIAGGGIAGAVQTTTVIARAGSTTTTGGLGNFVIATLELFASLAMSLLTIVVPVLSLFLLCAIGFWVFQVFRGWFTKKAVTVVP